MLMDIEVTARRLFRLCKSLPVPLEYLCAKFNIGLYFTKLWTCDAFYMTSLNKRLIVVNDSLYKPRMRFAIAHEFGHAVMGHGPIAFSRYGIGKRAHWQEVSANRFAAELLMPKPELVKYGYLAPGRIAEICEVSIHAATIRAEELGWRQRELQYMKWE